VQDVTVFRQREIPMTTDGFAIAIWDVSHLGLASMDAVVAYCPVLDTPASCENEDGVS
jgi:hypothetical protein